MWGEKGGKRHGRTSAKLYVNVKGMRKARNSLGLYWYMM
jgi:hypothetical protein